MSNMRKFIIAIFIFVIPFILLLLPYFITDPFKVLYFYSSYYPESEDEVYIETNRSYVSTRMYLQNKEKEQYDSFIFGSSKSGFFCVEDWKKYLPDNASCFHYDGSDESLYNIWRKIIYVNGKSTIKNALFCIDYQLLSKDTQDLAHLCILDPVLVDKNFTAFHKSFLKAYLTPKFLSGYFDYLIRGVQPYMYETQLFVKCSYIGYNAKYNESGNRYRNVIKFNDYFYKNNQNNFPQRPDTLKYISPILTHKHKEMLKDIRTILDNNHTNYLFIINPNYEQIKLNKNDSLFLDSIFDKKVIDFSGKNRITEDYHNYIDHAHFTGYVASELMRIAYEKNHTKQIMMLDSLYNINNNDSDK